MDNNTLYIFFNESYFVPNKKFAFDEIIRSFDLFIEKFNIILFVVDNKITDFFLQWKKIHPLS